MHRRLRVLLCLALLAWVSGVAAKGQTVWVALSQVDGAYLEAGQAIQRKLSGDEVVVRHWGEFAGSEAPPPKVIVAVGMEALGRVVGSDGRGWPKVPVVAMLVSRSALEKAAGDAGGRVTGVYLDQPFSRQMELLRLAMPNRAEVGILLGPNSRTYREALHRAAREAGLRAVVQEVETQEGIAAALQSVLADAEVLLAVSDPLVYNSLTAQNLLMGTYRRRVPVVAYSASFAKAGALLSLFSTPEQLAAQSAALVADILAGREMPPPQAPREFEISANANVARSLDIRLDVVQLQQRLGRPEKMR